LVVMGMEFLVNERCLLVKGRSKVVKGRGNDGYL